MGPDKDDGDIVMRWSVQSAAKDIEMTGNRLTPGTSDDIVLTRRSSRNKSAAQSGSHPKPDSDSDFDLEEFSRQEVEQLNSKDNHDLARSPQVDKREARKRRKRSRSLSRKAEKANRRNTRSRAQCPVHSRRNTDVDSVAGYTAPPIESDDDEDSEGSVRIVRRREGKKRTKRRKTNDDESLPVARRNTGNFSPVADPQPPSPLLSSEWLRATSGRYNYIPQRGDVVYFFPQGHAEAIAHSKSLGIDPLAVARQGLSSREKPRLDGSKISESSEPLCFSISEISYEFPCRFDIVKEKDRKKNGQSSSKSKKTVKCVTGRTVALLTLRKEQSGVWPQGLADEVSLPYYPVDDVPEYLVLASRVQTSLALNWKADDKFRMLFVNEKRVWQYYTGVVRKVMSENTGMGWNSVEVEYDNEEDPDRGALDKVSPWELEPLNMSQKASLQAHVGKGFSPLISGLSSVEPGLFIAIAREIESFRNNDVSCKANMSWLHTAGTLCNSAEYCKVIPCPIDLDLVLTRLCTGFYRHFAAFVDDIELLWSNAVTFKGRNSDEAKTARTVYNYLFNVGERTRQKLSGSVFPSTVIAGTSASARDPKARHYSNDASQAAVAGMANSAARGPYVLLAPRLPAVGVASPRAAQGLHDAIGTSSPSHVAGRGGLHVRNANVMQAVVTGAATHPGVGALPPVVPSVFSPGGTNVRGNSRSLRPSGRITNTGRLHTSPVHRVRGAGHSSGNGNVMPTYAPNMMIPSLQVTSTQTLALQPSALVHSSQRMMPPAQVPIAPRTAARSSFSHGGSTHIPANNTSARGTFAPPRSAIATSNSLSTLMGPTVHGNPGGFLRMKLLVCHYQVLHHYQPSTGCTLIMV